MRLAIIASLTAHAAALAALAVIDWRSEEPPPSIPVHLVAVPAFADPVADLAASMPAAAPPPSSAPAVADAEAVQPPDLAATLAGYEPKLAPQPKPPKPSKPAKPSRPSPATLAAIAPAAGPPAPPSEAAAPAPVAVAAVGSPAPIVERGPSLLPGNPLPGYPAAARRRSLEGRAVVRAEIAPDGRVAAVSLLSSSSHTLLDQAALDAVRQWHFSPARRGDETISAAIDVPVVFRLEN